MRLLTQRVQCRPSREFWSWASRNFSSMLINPGMHTMARSDEDILEGNHRIMSLGLSDGFIGILGLCDATLAWSWTVPGIYMGNNWPHAFVRLWRMLRCSERLPSFIVVVFAATSLVNFCTRCVRVSLLFIYFFLFISHFSLLYLCRYLICLLCLIIFWLDRLHHSSFDGNQASLMNTANA